MHHLANFTRPSVASTRATLVAAQTVEHLREGGARGMAEADTLMPGKTQNPEK